MTKLDLIGRPWVAFDPANRQHRRWFAEFSANRSWAKCPCRFIVPDDGGDLLSLIQQRLITFYVTKEFGKVVA